jgi:uncharacterized membrane protein YkgB
MSSPVRRESGGRLAARHENTSQPLVPAVPDRPPDAQSAVSRLKRRIVDLAIRWFEPAARIAVFVIYFWFGFLKLINLSPATPLASALTSHTIGMQYFNMSFKALALYECGLGLLFLIPALTWLSVVLLVIHMAIVSSPLIIVANVAWIHPLVPTLEGQYIIKDLAIIALAVGILAHRHLERLAPQTRLPPSALPVDPPRPAPPDTSGRASAGLPSGRTTSTSRLAR